MANRWLKITIEPACSWARWQLREPVVRDADTVLMVSCCADGATRQTRTELIGDKGDLLLCACAVLQALDKQHQLALLKMLWQNRRQWRAMKEVAAHD